MERVPFHLLLPLLFLWFSLGRCLVSSTQAPFSTLEAAVMTTTHGHKCSYSAPPNLCLHAMFCFCPSVSPLLLSLSQTHTHTNFRLAPASLPLYILCPSASPSWCPRLPCATLSSNVAWWCHRHNQDALRSICCRGRPLILYYVAVMGPDRGLPNCCVTGAEGLKRGWEWGECESDGSLFIAPKVPTVFLNSCFLKRVWEGHVANKTKRSLFITWVHSFGFFSSISVIWWMSDHRSWVAFVHGFQLFWLLTS